MQQHRTILIGLVLSIFSMTNCPNRYSVVATTTDQATNASVDAIHPIRHLRSSTKVSRSNTLASKSEVVEAETTTLEQTTSRRNDVTYQVDSETGGIIVTGNNFDDDFYDFYVESCDGFKFELDDNGICQVSTGYILIMVFVNIAIVLGIVIASCACCKCCVWYPYLCCASDAERLPKIHQGGNGPAGKAAYPFVHETKNSNSTRVEKATANNPATATPNAGTTDTEASKTNNIEPEFEC